MDWSLVIKSLLTLGGLGLILAIILLIASIKLTIKVDERETRIRSVLPGANCGACGYPGCDGYAAAIVAGKAPLNRCSVGGPSVAKQIGEIMGQQVTYTEPKVAVLICRGGKNEAASRFQYHGAQDCRQAALLLGGPKACIYGCVGLGHCVTVCPVGAITMGENRLPAIDEKKCIGCGKCVAECPKGTLILIPRQKLVYLACISHDRGKAVKDVCSVGCIACGLCAKVCPVGALKMERNLPVMDFEKCIDCGICVHKCPTKSFIDRAPGRPKASINPRCNGCGECVKVCQFKAIEGEPDKQRRVIPEKCIGCGQCVLVCPVKAIDLVGALGHAVKTV
jgi:Na+-translocating ferredoxin:NAD+ oxidoreductase RNF subunit RnfB|uniref:Ion-translocating oxidoreductase complex subunit B n=1 Tax=candidate division WOR-3 bacterium TaxID=2052148 RepID=A0A7V3PUK9_UNCW3